MKAGAANLIEVLPEIGVGDGAAGVISGKVVRAKIFHVLWLSWRRVARLAVNGFQELEELQGLDALAGPKQPSSRTEVARTRLGRVEADRFVVAHVNDKEVGLMAGAL